MATSGGAELVETEKRRGEDFRESCSLCMESYHGRNPKLLPCFHTFCLPCLTTLAESATISERSRKAVAEPDEKENVEEEPKVDIGNDEEPHENDSETQQKDPSTGDDESEYSEEEIYGREDDGVEMEGGSVGVNSSTGSSAASAVFLCPTCQAPVTVPEGGVAALQTNFYIVSEPEEAPQPLQCEMCEEEDRKEATHICDKCQQRMCRACRRLHDKIVDTGEHHVKALNNLEKVPMSETKTEVKKCRIHRDQELCLFCEDCDISICLVCKLTLHQPHETEDIAVTILRGKEELAALVKNAKEQVQMMVKLVTRLSRDVKELSRQQQEAVYEVRVRYDDIIRWANRSRDELMETITVAGESALAGLKAKEMSACNIIETLSEILPRASPASSASVDVLLMKDELQAALLQEDKFEELKKDAEREQHNNFLTVKGDSTAVDLAVVKAYLGELSAGKSGTDRSFVSLREQIQALNAKLKTVEKRQDTSVAFYAYECMTLNVPGDGVIVLSKVTTNILNAYTKGVFTVPVSGLYSFQVVA